MSNPDLHARASELFLELRNLGPEQRTALLRSKTEDDPRLRREVETLFEHDSRATEGVAGEGRAPTQPKPPGSIGPYRIVERIGQGGSGQVFLAEQDEPVRRRVAIKVVPAAALSPDLAARFEVERRALESTKHPNIARILDAGRTREGLPYLVMDLVEGLPITRYCDAHALSLADRIRLVLPVADALQHAHQRGVVHRDVKPANILVAERDSGRPRGRLPQPTVLDFGIAKPVAGEFALDSPVTSGLPLGTPAYMAPEQTQGSTVDVRADVYGLGAVAYELASGEPPIRDTGNAPDALDLLHRIREEVPDLLSRRLSPHLASAPRALLADLDAILGCALEKDPDRRYPTMDAFAADLRRMLAREPIDARPPTLAYRAACFARRNRILVAAGALVAVALVMGAAGLATGLGEARRQRALAEREELTQREINRFLTEDLLLAATPDQQGADVKAIDLLRRAGERLESRFPDRPMVAAGIHQTLADAFAELGDYDAAEHHIAAALELRVTHAGAESPEALHSEIVAADLLLRREDYRAGKQTLVPLIARARLILGADDPALYTALNDLGVCLESLGELGEARAALREALAGRRRLLEPHAREIVTSMGNLALVLDRQGDLDGSLAMMEQALALTESAPEVSRYTLLVLCNNIGATYQDYGRDAEAVPYLRRATVLTNEVLGPDHPAAVSIRLNLAGLEAEFGEPLEAAKLYDEVVRYRTELLGPSAEGTIAARHGYWDSILAAGEHERVAAGLDQLLADAEQSLGPNHWLTAQTMTTLAVTWQRLGQLEAALDLAKEAERRMQVAFGAEHARTETVTRLVVSLRTQLAASAE